MRAPILIPILTIVACSTTSTPSSNNDAADAGSSADAGAQDDANADASTLTPYEQTVLGSSWTVLANGPKVTQGKQDDIYFLNAQLGFAASGPNEAIYKTTDGGDTWTQIFKNAGTYFRAVLFTDENNGFAGNIGAGLSSSITDTNVIYRTTDGGTTWAPVTTITGPAPSGICNFTAVDAQHIFAVGRANGPSYMLASSDGGATWTSIDLTTQLAMLVDAHFFSATEGVVVGMSADASSVCSVLRTTDAGTTWNQVFASKTSGSLCWKVQFPSNNVGYVAVQDATTGPATFGKTIDGGQTWTEMPLPPGKTAKSAYSAIGVGFITENVGWMSPEDATLPTYRTSDGGQTWQVDATLKSPINRFRFVDQNTAYAIGGSVWKLTIPTSAM